jgi:hypothetical protein
MLSVEDWAEIRRLHRAEGLPNKVIARVLGMSKNTVKAALASDQPPKYLRPQRVRSSMRSSRASVITDRASSRPTISSFQNPRRVARSPSSQVRGEEPESHVGHANLR